jgi:hypothetical protein
MEREEKLIEQRFVVPEEGTDVEWVGLGWCPGEKGGRGDDEGQVQYN